MDPSSGYFPTRPLRLMPKARSRGAGWIWALVAVLAALPAAYWGTVRIGEEMLRRDLQARGVEAIVVDGRSECRSYRSRYGSTRQAGCTVHVSYRTKDDETVREGSVRAERAAIFTPRVLYDPQNPARIMAAERVERPIGMRELGPVAAMLLFPVPVIALWFGLGRYGFAAAARSPSPRAVPVTNIARAPPRIGVTFTDPASGKTHRDAFLGGSEPLLIQAPPGADQGQAWALAIAAPRGRPYLLDRDLAYLDFTDEERRRIREAVGA